MSGAHIIICTKKPEKVGLFFRDVLKFPYVDVGDGWLIFGLPRSEVAMHPSSENGKHELYLMCDDIKEFVASTKKHKIKCGAVLNQRYGLFVQITLPGGGKLGVYQPRHARPKNRKAPGS